MLLMIMIPDDPLRNAEAVVHLGRSVPHVELALWGVHRRWRSLAKIEVTRLVNFALSIPVQNEWCAAYVSHRHREPPESLDPRESPASPTPHFGAGHLEAAYQFAIA